MKAFLVIAPLLAVVLAFAGCSTSSKEHTQAAQPQAAPQPKPTQVTLADVQTADAAFKNAQSNGDLHSNQTAWKAFQVTASAYTAQTGQPMSVEWCAQYSGMSGTNVCPTRQTSLKEQAWAKVQIAKANSDAAYAASQKAMDAAWEAERHVSTAELNQVGTPAYIAHAKMAAAANAQQIALHAFEAAQTAYEKQYDQPVIAARAAKIIPGVNMSVSDYIDGHHTSAEIDAFSKKAEANWATYEAAHPEHMAAIRQRAHDELNSPCAPLEGIWTRAQQSPNWQPDSASTMQLRKVFAMRGCSIPD